MHGASTATATAGPGLPAARRADAGTVRLGGRDVSGLLLCGDMYGAPYDLIAAFLGVKPTRPSRVPRGKAGPIGLVLPRDPADA